MCCKDTSTSKRLQPSISLPARAASLEQVSRECERVVSLEGDCYHANFIRQCFKKQDEEKDIMIRGDVFRFQKKHATKSLTSSLPPLLTPQVIARDFHSCSTAICPTRKESSYSNTARTTISPCILASWSVAATSA